MEDFSFNTFLKDENGRLSQHQASGEAQLPLSGAQVIGEACR